MLLADCGNSCCKIAPADQPEQVTYLAYDQLAGHLPALTAAHRDLLLLPGSAQGAATLRAAWPGTVTSIGTDLPLPDCGQYATMGHDRILAGMAAVVLCRTDVIVVDAGTALTVDAWRCADQQGAPPAFLGGAIAPGPEAMLRGLQASAPALPLPPMDDPSTWQRPGTDTPGCLLFGCQTAFHGALRALVARLGQETGIELVVGTGGWLDPAPNVTPALPIQRFAPALVLLGMAQLTHS